MTPREHHDLTILTSVSLGVELQKGLAHVARCNIKHVTEKGLNNIKQDLFAPKHIKERGVLKDVVPPHCIVVQADIMQIEDLGHVDLVFAFDDVNNPCTFHHLGAVWNKRKSKIWKVFITNQDPENLKECGFKNIINVDCVACKFSLTGERTESRPFFVYVRKHLKRSAKEWIFEDECHRSTTTGPFKDIWEKFHKGRTEKQGEYPFNSEIVKMNLAYDTNVAWMDNVKRPNSTRMPKTNNYNENVLSKYEWSRAEACIRDDP